MRSKAPPALRFAPAQVMREVSPHLQDAVDGPECQEPGEGVAGAKGDVDGGGGDEAARQHDARRRASPEHSAHKLGETIGNWEQ